MNNPEITSTFKLVFGTVVALTMLSGGTAFSLAAREQLSPQQTRVFETYSATWQMGAVLGYWEVKRLICSISTRGEIANKSKPE